MHEWWTADPNERYWLEVTGRDDLGEDLRAPETDEKGRDNWRYSLFKLAMPGDVVFHYYTPDDAIVAVSSVAGRWSPHQIKWGARGTSARSKGIEPHVRQGYRVPLTSFARLAKPLTLETLRDRKGQLLELVHKLESLYGDPLYFPFELSSRPVRPLQGYAFKLPASFVVSQIDQDLPPPPAQSELLPPEAPKETGGQRYGTSSARNRAVEMRAMQAAEKYFVGKGFRVTPVHATHSYDLQAERGDEILHVEVKGISGGPGAVFLTRNEVDLSRKHPDRSVLFILHSVTVKGYDKEAAASGGKRVVYWPWKIDEGRLEATEFRYSPPKRK